MASWWWQSCLLFLKRAHMLMFEVRECDVKGDILPSCELSENFSLLNYEDLLKYYEDVKFKSEAQPSTHLADIMSRTTITASLEQSLEEVNEALMQAAAIKYILCTVCQPNGEWRSRMVLLRAKVETYRCEWRITISEQSKVADTRFSIESYKSWEMAAAGAPWPPTSLASIMAQLLLMEVKGPVEKGRNVPASR